MAANRRVLQGVSRTPKRTVSKVTKKATVARKIPAPKIATAQKRLIGTPNARMAPPAKPTRTSKYPFKRGHTIGMAATRAKRR